MNYEHIIDQGRLELRTLAAARQAQLVDRWRAFLALELDELDEQDPELLETVLVGAIDPDWTGGPVAAFAPGSCEGFRAISRTLGKLHREDRAAWTVAYAQVPPLFRLGCDFGDAVEIILDADAEPEARTEAMSRARALWFAIATLAGDAGSDE